MMRALVFCEGYQDRSFIGSWLECRHGCSRSGVASGHKGVHAKLTTAGAEILIVPTDGFANLPMRIRAMLKLEPVARCAIIVDTDGFPSADRATGIRQSIEGVEGLPPTDVAFWDPRLEQHIEDALRDVFPERMAAVDAFLESRPDPTAQGKEAAFTYCAAWKPDSFGEHFFSWAWQHHGLAESLERRLPRSARDAISAIGAL